MSRLDLYHDAVRHALEKDGWTITHDPLTLSVGGRDIYVDLGAEKPIAAEKEGRRIAVEIKSFWAPPLCAISRRRLASLSSTATCSRLKNPSDSSIWRSGTRPFVE